MLQKLENLYLSILRFVVILAAGLLLVAVLALGLSSLRALQSAPTEALLVPKVSDDSLKKAILKKEGSTEALAPGTKPSGAAADPNQALFDRAAAAIIAFDTAHSGGAAPPDKERVADLLKRRANELDEPKLTGTYAKQLTESLERLLKDPGIVAMAKDVSPVDTVNRVLDTFAEQFEEQIKKNAKANQAKQQEHMEQRMEGQQSLYMAGAAFAGFLMIVFLSIIIRIERNLRNLERPSA